MRKENVMRPHFFLLALWIALSPTGSSASCTVVCAQIQRVVDGTKIDIDRLNELVGTEMRKMSATLESIASVVVLPPPPSPPVAPGLPGTPCPPHTPPPSPHSASSREASGVTLFGWVLLSSYAAFLLLASCCSCPSRARVLV